MKDLEIRGAGNLLGGEQSGHIAGRRLRPLHPAGRRGRGGLPRRRRGAAGRDEDRAAGRRAPAARLRAGGAAAPGGVPKLATRRDRRGGSTRSAPSWSTATASLPPPVENLIEVARFRVHARRAGLPTSACRATTSGSRRSSCRESQQLRLTRLYPGSLVKPAVRTVLVPQPETARVGGQPLRDRDVLEWARRVIEAVLLDDLAAAATVASNTSKRRRGRGHVVKREERVAVSVTASASSAPGESRSPADRSVALGAAALLSGCGRARPGGRVNGREITVDHVQSAVASLRAADKAAFGEVTDTQVLSVLLYGPYAEDAASAAGKGDLRRRGPAGRARRPSRTATRRPTSTSSMPPPSRRCAATSRSPSSTTRPARTSWTGCKGDVKVSPRYGTFDAATGSVTAPSPNWLTPAAGPPPARRRPAEAPVSGGLTLLLTSPRVPAGLLSWSAWQALTSAELVLAPAVRTTRSRLSPTPRLRCGTVSSARRGRSPGAGRRRPRPARSSGSARPTATPA